jgi:hypothetical protein
LGVKLKGILLIIGVATAALALWPAGAGAANMRGIVVGKQRGLLLVATPSGVVQAIRGHASIGSRLVGTQVVGRATKARIHGVVVKRIGSTLFLSSNKHLLAVHTGRVLAAVSPTPAQPGTVVNATVGVKENGELDEQDEDDVGQVAGNIQVQATITAVGAGTVTLSVNGQSLTVNLPGGLTLPASLVGQTVTLNVSLKNDDNDNDDNDDQGDDDHGGDHHGGDGGGDD